jgi:hypothetical protein
MWLCLSSCQGGPKAPAEHECDGVHVAVPKAGASVGVIVLDIQDHEELVVVRERVYLTCRSCETVVSGMWGVAWELSDEDRLRMNEARQECGEVGLVYKNRRVAWWYDGNVPPSGVLQWPTLTKEEAEDLAAHLNMR